MRQKHGMSAANARRHTAHGLTRRTGGESRDTIQHSEWFIIEHCRSCTRRFDQNE